MDRGKAVMLKAYEPMALQLMLSSARLKLPLMKYELCTLVYSLRSKGLSGVKIAKKLKMTQPYINKIISINKLSKGILTDWWESPKPLSIMAMYSITRLKTRSSQLRCYNRLKVERRMRFYNKANNDVQSARI